MAHTILLGLVLVPYGNHSHNELDLFEALLCIPIYVIGLLFAYSRNGGDAGSDFVAKYVAIGWVVGLRLLAVTVLIYFIVGVAHGFVGGEIPSETTIAEAMLFCLMALVFAWRVAFHIGEVAEGEPA